MKRESSCVAVLLIALTLALPTIVDLGQSVGSTWVSMVGSVKKYGDEGIGGYCRVFAEVDSWAQVYAFWVRFQVLPIPGSYVFHYTKLATASLVKLDHEGKDFYIQGTWNVYKVTIQYRSRDETSKIVEPIVEGARGEFAVTGNWKDFNIRIDSPDVKVISGTIAFHRVTIRAPIPRGDIAGGYDQAPDGRIDISDLVVIARAYGSVPGMSRYNFNADVNFDFRVDLQDLLVPAVNFGKEY